MFVSVLINLSVLHKICLPSIILTPTFGLLDIIKYVKTNLKEMVFEDFESE